MSLQSTTNTNRVVIAIETVKRQNADLDIQPNECWLVAAFVSSVCLLVLFGEFSIARVCGGSGRPEHHRDRPVMAERSRFPGTPLPSFSERTSTTRSRCSSSGSCPEKYRESCAPIIVTGVIEKEKENGLFSVRFFLPGIVVTVGLRAATAARCGRATASTRLASFLVASCGILRTDLRALLTRGQLHRRCLIGSAILPRGTNRRRVIHNSKTPESDGVRHVSESCCPCPTRIIYGFSASPGGCCDL